MQDVNDISRILVTGAGGFIGKSVVAHLLKRGWKVRAVLRSPDRPFASVDPALEVVYADMRDRSALVHALRAVDVVVHLAAAKNDEKWSYDVNVGGAERLVEACRLAGCGRIIFRLPPNSYSNKAARYSRACSVPESRAGSLPGPCGRLPVSAA